MTPAQRHLLERFAVGDRPLNRAIAAALAEIDRLSRAGCRACHGAGFYKDFAGEAAGRCTHCGGTGRES